MESKSRSERQRENSSSSVLEKYESPQVSICDITDTSSGGTVDYDTQSTQS
ncbi:MAG: hypothetical protein PHV82_03635 [Victivallaceae bacterium]|nr:hypothetical protein [Victivallaceae bacterium]